MKSVLRVGVRSVGVCAVLLVLLVAQVAVPMLTIDNTMLILVSSTRVSRTLFDFTYRAMVTNTGTTDMTGVAATLTSLSSHTQVMEGMLIFGDVPAGSTVTSSDTFTIRHDRSFPFRSQDLVWQITGTPVLHNIAPVAQNDTISTEENSPALIDVVANDTDPDGTIDITTVAIVAGPGHGMVDVHDDGTVTYTPTPSFFGTDSFTYTVKDNTGALSNTATVTVTVREVNDPPVANAGKDLSAETDMPVMLDGSASFDPNGDMLAFAWRVLGVPQGSAVTDASLMGATTTAPRFIPDISGVYELEVEVSDGSLSATDTVMITATPPNVRPNAHAGLDQTTLVRMSVLLNGTGSQDPDNGPLPLAFQWLFAEMPQGSTLTNADISGADTALASFTPDVAGGYRLTLEVFDGAATAQDEVRVTAMLPNVPPNADAGPDVVVPFGREAVLDGTGSHDPDQGPGPLVSMWTFVTVPQGSGLTDTALQDATTLTPRFLPDVPAIYLLRLDVSDGMANAHDQVMVTANDVPTAADDALAVAEDTTLTVPAPGVLGNDQDSVGNPLTAALVSDVSHGTLMFQADGSFTYTPATNFHGTDSFTYRVSDGLVDSNTATVTITVTPSNDTPIANAGLDQTVDEGTLVTLDGRASSDPDADTLTFQWSQLAGPAVALSDVTSSTPTFTAPQVEAETTLMFQLRISDGQASSVAMGNVTVRDLALPSNRPPVLAPIGDMTVALGTTLAVTLSATDPDGDTLHFSATPLPLPANASLNAMTGQFTFTPAANQVGDVVLSFIVSDGVMSDAKTITITVQGAPVGGMTAITGRLLDTNAFVQDNMEVPIVGATLSLLDTGIVTTSDNAGNFILMGVPSGVQVLDLNPTTANPAPDGSPYAGVREKVTLIAGVTNVVERPFFLPRVAMQSLTTVNPTTTTAVTNPTLQVTLTIPPNTAKDANGNNFTGQLSISEVPGVVGPVPLPANVQPSMLITIQPVGVTFATPVPITFPNTDNLSPGSEVDLWSVDPQLGIFVIVGTGRVSVDGSRVETISGGIRAADWHFILPPGTQSNKNKPQNCPPCPMIFASDVVLASGDLVVDHFLAGYRSLGQSRALRLVYNSLSADPQPVISTETTILQRAAVPPMLSARLSVGGVDQGNEVFTDTSGLNENVDETVRQVGQFDAASMDTGLYPYMLTFTSHYAQSAISSTLSDNVLVNNQRQSPLGLGWTLDGLQRLHLQPSGDTVLTAGNGAIQLFTKGSNDQVVFAAPAFFPVREEITGTNFSVTDIAIADLNRDGIADIVTVADIRTVQVGGVFVHVGSVSVLLGNGDGTFQAARQFPTNSDPEAVVIADLNRDGIPDLVVAHRSSASVSVLLGNGDGTFQAARQFPANLSPLSVAIADLNRDGIPDLVVANRDAGISVLLGRGDGTFHNPLQFLVGRTSVVAIADLNNDGALDIVTASFGVHASVLLGNGDGSFQAPRPVPGNPTPWAPWAMAIADLNRDGIPDLVGANYSSGGVSTLLGNGDGTFQAARQFPTNLFPWGPRLTIADLNRDGIPDIVVFGDRCYLYCPFPFDKFDPQSLAVLLGKGDGTFQDGLNFWPKDFSYGLSPAAIADLNGDGVLDVATIDDEARVAVLFTIQAGGGFTRFGSPAGDFSTLVQFTIDRGFTRTMKDGTKINFDARGLHTSTVDRNGNTTAYSYAGSDRLATITDPVGLVTTFAYSGDRLASITDPQGRLTSFAHDANGNLTRITDPDGTSRRFAYDARGRMISQTSKIGAVTTYAYDIFGRVHQGTRPDGSTVQLVPKDTMGLVAPASGLGTRGNPVPVMHPAEAVSTMTDGEGRATTYGLGRFGEITSSTDAAGLTTQVDRNTDGRPTRIVPPSGQILSFTYDGKGNRLTSADAILGGTTRFTYDPLFNQVTAITDSQGHTTSIQRDAAGNPTRIASPAGRLSTLGYDSRGLPTTQMDSLEIKTTYAYDALTSNLLRVTQDVGGEQRIATVTYTSEGYFNTVTDAVGRVLSFTYDPLGRLLSQTLYDGRVVRFTYDADGNLTSITPPGRPAHVFAYTPADLQEAYIPPDVGAGSNRTLYSYNAAQQLMRVTRPDGLATDLGYDTAGRLSAQTLVRGQIGYAYSATTGQLTTVTAPDGGTVSYNYQGDLLTRITWDGTVRGSANLTYDPLGRPSTLAINGGNTITFQYDADSLITLAGDLSIARDPQSGLITATTLGTVTDTRNYTAFGELESYRATQGGTDFYTAQYLRDKIGRIVEKTETVEGTIETFAYRYDQNGRLLEVKQNSAIIATYVYDSNGNRLNRITPSGTTTGTYDAQDRLTQYGSIIYNYTANGELFTKTTTGQTTTYNYDELGNLLNVTLPDGTQIEYLIDGQNRRIGKKVNGSQVQGFLYQDKIRLIAELDGSNQIVSYFVYSSQSNMPDYMVKNGNTYRIISDHLGSPRIIIDASTGIIAQRMDYDEFGNVLLDTNPGFQPFGFAGGLYDRDTRLVRFGARDYDAEIGRWTVKDPIRFNGKDLNLYGYILNDPINSVDPTGLIGPLVAIGLCLVDPPCVAALSALTLATLLAAQNAVKNTVEHFEELENAKSPPLACEDEDGGRNPAQDKKLTPQEIKKMQAAGIDPHDLKGGKNAGSRDLFKDDKGNIYVKPKNGSGPGEPTGININNL